MATKEELETALINAYKQRYGEDAVVKLQYNGTTEPNGIYHHWQLWYKDANGIVRCDSNIYAISFDGINFEWFNNNPAQEFIPQKTFTQKLSEKLKEDVSIKYFEIISSNEEIKKAKVSAILSNNTSKTFLCYFDESENLVKEEIA